MSVQGLHLLFFTVFLCVSMCVCVLSILVSLCVSSLRLSEGAADAVLLRETSD